MSKFKFFTEVPGKDEKGNVVGTERSVAINSDNIFAIFEGSEAGTSLCFTKDGKALLLRGTQLDIVGQFNS